MNRRIVQDLIADYRAVEWAESAVLQDQAQARSFSGPKAIQDWLRTLFEEGFPNPRIDIHRVIADGNRAVAEYTLRGRHAGFLREFARPGARWPYRWCLFARSGKGE